MSNEELVAATQAGEDRMGELWEQVERLVKWKAHRIMAVLDGRGGVEFDDLYQAMVAAVGSYKPECGAFSTWFMFHLKTAFAEGTGYRAKRGRNEPLNHSLSLDTPLSDDADSDDLMAVIADPAGMNNLQDVEEAIYHRQLREALEVALDAIPDQYSEVLRQRHYEGLTLAEIGELRGVGVERVRQMENKAIRYIRRPSIACHLRPFYDFDFYCGTGLGAFQRTGMSIQVKYLIIEEERREREAQERKRQVEENQRWLAEQQAARQRDLFIDEIMQSLSPEGQEKLKRMLAERGT